MFLERFDVALNSGDARLVVPSIMEPDFELDYLEDAPPVRIETEYGELCNTGPSEQEESIRGSLERYQKNDPAHKYILMPFHARIQTFSARTNRVIKWKEEKGFSVWRTSW